MERQLSKSTIVPPPSLDRLLSTQNALTELPAETPAPLLRPLGLQPESGSSVKARLSPVKLRFRRAGVITQIQSKCANGHSCTDNALNNFNPKRDQKNGGNASWYSQYRHQQCRPLYLDLWTPASIGAREQKSDSTCFFCIEPCNYAGIEAATRTSAQLKASQCVGRAGTSAANDNSQPISGSAVDLFDEQLLGQTQVTELGSPLTLDAFENNYYGTKSIALARNAPDGSTMTENRVISRIQQEQLGF